MLGEFFEQGGDFRDVVQSRVEAGQDLNLHKEHAIRFLPHIVWHEGYLNDQIKLALKATEGPIIDEEEGPVTWDVWMQRKSGRPHAVFHRLR